ncbi:hypothetical protein [Thermodesulfatator atlanticus]|uniref:hypothetical protein n=1 Tax=Thermodesulfatator atlanticus TaxID=501497 RepID=UPI0003B74AF0|nr:hypothetical protein [Thermodesulfatator atlanticus]
MPWFYIALAGVFWGLASLVRSIPYPLTPFVAVFLFLVWPNKRQGLLVGLVFFLAVFVTLSPWIIRNYQTFGHFVAVDTMGGLNLYMGNYEHTPLHRAWAAVDNPPEIAWYHGHEKELASLNEAEKQRWAIKEALAFMKEHPGLTALRTVIKAANFWQLERTIIAGMQKDYFPGLQNRFLEIVFALSILLAYVLVAIFGFSGLFWETSTCLTKKKVLTSSCTALWFFWLIILYFTAIHALVFGHSRYHLPLVPILCMYAAFLTVSFKEIWQTKRRFLLKIMIPVSVFFGAIWIYDVFIGSREKIEALLQKLL